MLKNLALRACADPSHLSGTPRFETARAGRHAYLVSQITIRPPPPPSATEKGKEWDSRPLEISFVIPKAAMNINGPTVAAAFEQLVPPADQLDRPRHPSPPASSAAEEEEQPDASPGSRRRRGKIEPASGRAKHLFRLLTIQDDLDLSPSTLKYQPGGGPRGHNGVRSVSHALSSTKYHRLWVGIGRPEERGGEVARYVLSPLGREEVRKCEYLEEEGRGGEVLERAWREILRIGFDGEP